MARKHNYLVTVMLAAALVFLLWRDDPLYAVTALEQAMSLIPAAGYFVMTGIVILAFILLGGRWLTNIMLAFVLLYFLPDINSSGWNQGLWGVATFITRDHGPAAATVYVSIHRWASYAVYAAALLLVVGIARLVRRVAR